MVQRAGPFFTTPREGGSATSERNGCWLQTECWLGKKISWVASAPKTVYKFIEVDG